MGPLPDAVLARLQAMGEEGYTFSADRDQLARHYAIDGIGPSCYVTPGSAAEVAEVVSGGGELMRRLKHIFDPSGILSPGRWIGGL